MQRVLALRWRPGEPRGRARAEQLSERALAVRPWTQVVNRRGVRILHCSCQADPHSLFLPDQTGLVVGPLFHALDQAKGAQPVALPNAAQAHQWCISGPETFVRNFWGSYLALLHDRQHDVLYVLRDPAGARPCFHAVMDGVDVVFTHAEDFVAMGGELEVDADWLSAFIAQPRHVSARTAIKGVREVTSGQCLSLKRSESIVVSAWRPVGLGPCFGVEDFETVAQGLRAVVEYSAGAWGQSAGRILHRLSGGLDSSVALAALRAGAPDCEIVCLNERPSGLPEGDERIFARTAAANAGVRLIELELPAEGVDFTRLETVELSAKPSLSQLSFAEPRWCDVVKGEGFDFISAGKGGDQIFQRSPPALAVADAACDGAPWRTLASSVIDLARLRDCSIWRLVSPLIMQGWLRRPVRALPVCSVTAPLATDHGRSIATLERALHPWGEEIERATPGRAFQIQRLADLSYYHMPSLQQNILPYAPLLASQPVIEFCLRAPPHFMFRGGVDRALERAAFADALPRRILLRRSKGDTTRHFSAVLAGNNAWMRAQLLDGALSRLGVVDSAALKSALDIGEASGARSKAGLMACLVAEIWLRQFERSSKAALSVSGHPPSER